MKKTIFCIALVFMMATLSLSRKVAAEDGDEYSSIQNTARMNAGTMPEDAARKLMAEDYLVDGSVKFNAVSAHQLAIFDKEDFADEKTADFLGISSGIILSSGDASLAIDAEYDDANKGSYLEDYCYGDGSTFGDSDLYEEFGDYKQYDTAVLEFTVKAPEKSYPMSMTFNYAYATQEMTESPQYNDVFALFVSEAKDSADAKSTFKNYAIMKTDTVGNTGKVTVANMKTAIVAADTANGGDNGIYYVDELSGVKFVDGASGSEFETLENYNFLYNGLTDVYSTTISDIEGGKYYTVKLAIADASDCGYDGAVFLQANSLYFGIEAPKVDGVDGGSVKKSFEQPDIKLGVKQYGTIYVVPAGQPYTTEEALKAASVKVWQSDSKNGVNVISGTITDADGYAWSEDTSIAGIRTGNYAAYLVAEYDNEKVVSLPSETFYVTPYIASLPGNFASESIDATKLTEELSINFGTAEYDDTTQTLAVDNIEFITTSEAGIILPANGKIVASGDAAIETRSTEPGGAITSTGSVELETEGNLKLVSASGYGISTENEDIAISGNGNVSILAPNGISTSGNVELNGNVAIDSENIGISCDTLYVKNGTVTINFNDGAPFSDNTKIVLGEGYVCEGGTITEEGVFVPNFGATTVVLRQKPSIGRAMVVTSFDQEKAPTYTGTTYSPVVTVSYDGKELKLNEDYIISGTHEASNAGEYELTIIGTGEYIGTQTVIWKILERSFDTGSISATPYAGIYDGLGHTVIVQIPKDAVITYSLIENSTYSIDPIVVTDFTDGEKVIYFKVSQENYKDYYGSTYVNITKATVTAPTIKSKMYTGDTLSADVEASSIYRIELNDGGIEVGTYDVILVLNDSLNYKWIDSETANETLKFEITARPKYAITDYSDEFGNAVTSDIQNAEKGTKVTLTVITAEEYRLTTIGVTTATGSAITLLSDNSFVMPEAEVKVNAVFTKNTYDITGYSDAIGNAVTANIQNAAKGTKVILAVAPVSEYALSILTVTDINGIVVPVASDNTFVMPGAAVTVSATFTQNTYTITDYSDENGNKVSADVDKAAKGTIVTLTITSTEGYTFNSLTVTDVAGNVMPVNDNEFVMPATNVIIKSVFNKKTPAPTPTPDPVIIIIPQTQPIEDSGKEDASGTEEISGIEDAEAEENAEATETPGIEGTETEGSEAGENADAEGAETAQETVGTNPITEKKDALVIDDLLSTDNNGEAATEADKEAITEAIIEAIETAIAESGTKDFVLKADEQTVTEQGIENKAYADATSEEITEITKPSETKSVTLESAVMETLANAEEVESLTVMTSVADVEFDAKTIESINEQSDGSVQLVVTLVKEEIAQNENEDNKVYFDVSLIKEDGTKITTFDGGNIKVTLPIPKAIQNEKTVVVYTDQKGHYSPVNGTVNSDGTFTFITGHLSEYILMTQREAEKLYNYIYDYGTLNVHVADRTENTVTLDWNQYEDADGYIIYGNFCNSNGVKYKVKKLVTITDPSTTEYTISGLESGSHYKFRVKAFKMVDGEKYVTVKSYLVHATTLGGKCKSTAVIDIDQTGMKKENELTLKAEQTYEIKAVRYDENGSKVRHAGIRYQSLNPEIATVSLRDGKITAVSSGKCTVLAIAENGLCEEIKVTVK